MDIKDRIMGDQPDSFLHKIASIVPGYKGYVDRERRRDADKLLRMHLARQYSAQRDRLNRVQQTLMRAKRLESIAEVDRMAGVLQRFIDRLSTATYGYTGMFDPVRIEAEDLDQLYAFDMSLASGVERVGAAIDSIEASATDAEELPAAMSRLSALLDELNRRLDERADLLSTGRRLDPGDYRELVSDLERPTPASYSTSGMDMATDAGMGSGEGMSAGTPTTNISRSGTQVPPAGMAHMSEGNTSFSEMTSEQEMGNAGAPGYMPTGDETGTGIQTASSPSMAPGAPAGDVVEGLDMANRLDMPVGDAGPGAPATNEPGPLGGEDQTQGS